MKISTIIICLFTGLLGAACKKDGFDYKLYQPQPGDIDSIYLSAGSASLIADGNAALQFVVETYRNYKVSAAGGGTKDSMVFVDYRNLPEGSCKILKLSGEEAGMQYSTTQTGSGTESFYAKVGNTVSETRTVTIRPKATLPEKRYFEVIFHIFELNPTDPEYDKLTYQQIKPDQLKSAIADLNAVFNNAYGKDPNGASANIEFRLADKDEQGNELTAPGFRTITYDKSWMLYPPYWGAADFTSRVNTTPSYSWDFKKYLNVYVIPGGAVNWLGDYSPKYQVIPNGGTKIPGLNQIINDENDLPTDQNYETYCVGVPRTMFFPGTDRRIELSPYFGRYFGLKITYGYELPIIDYCNDTRKYLSSDQYKSLIKTSVDGMKFTSNNAMDDVRFPSLRNSFTLDQVNRIRSVLLQSPNRKNSKPQ